ncbi:MAG: hypothetical protein ACXWC7_10210, partial [Chitinophagaceae bacterium]
MLLRTVRKITSIVSVSDRSSVIFFYLSLNITKAAIAAAMTPFASLSTFGQGYQEAINKTPITSPPSDLKITDVKCGY